MSTTPRSIRGRTLPRARPRYRGLALGSVLPRIERGVVDINVAAHVGGLDALPDFAPAGAARRPGAAGAQRAQLAAAEQAHLLRVAQVGAGRRLVGRLLL